MATGAELSALPLSLPGETVNGGNGLAVHPVTGELFGIIKVAGFSGRVLATIDPLTGVATNIGDTGDKFADIAFDPAGNLYGVTGDGATVASTLFTIDTATAVSTLVVAFGAGTDGEVIAFNPVDGMMYHHSGRDTDPAYQKVDLNTLVITDITRSGFNFDEVFGMVWDHDAGHFLLTNLDQELVSVTADGFATQIATGLSYGYNRGLALPPPLRVAHMVDPFSPTLRTIDPDDGRRISSLELTLPGSTVLGGNGLAVHPSTGELYAIIKVSGVTGRVLSVIDPLTGIATSVGNTGDNFAAIDFDQSGNLYGVTGNGGSTPESLFSIDPTDATATFLVALGAGSDGESIAFNHSDGFMYHMSGRDTDSALERIDLNTLAVTDIPRSGFNYDEVFGLAWDPVDGHLLMTNLDQELVSVTTDGFATLISSGLAYGYNRGFAFTPGNLDADLSITKDDGVTSVMRGEMTTYTIVVSNHGPLSSPSALVSDIFPPDLVSVTWTCTPSGSATCTAAGVGDIADVVSLDVGDSVTYSATATVDASASGTLDNTATVFPTPGMTDPNGTDDSATDSNAVIPEADLTITKDNGVTSVVAGAPVSYSITVSNLGPDDVVGATVIDLFPPELTNVTWTCSPGSGADCTAAGVGNITEGVDLTSGSSLVFSANAVLSSSASGTLSNTATVDPPAGVVDQNPANNSATDADLIIRIADVSVTNTSTSCYYLPGESVVYTVVVGNTGPNDVAGVSISNSLPVEIEGADWTCAGSGGGICTAAGMGAISDSADLPAGAVVTYTLSATVSAGASGNMVNNVEATVPFGTIDPNPENNSSSHWDALEMPIFCDGLETGDTDGWSAATP